MHQSQRSRITELLHEEIRNSGEPTSVVDVIFNALTRAGVDPIAGVSLDEVKEMLLEIAHYPNECACPPVGP